MKLSEPVPGKQRWCCVCASYHYQVVALYDDCICLSCARKAVAMLEVVEKPEEKR